MSNVKAVFADADGTLVNTLQLIRHGQYQAAVAYLKAYGIPADQLPSYETYETHLNQVIGGPVRHTFEATIRSLFESTPEVDISRIDYDELTDNLRSIQDQLAAEYVRSYDGLDELCVWLGEQRLGLGINTSGHAHHVVRNFGIALPRIGCQALYLDASQNQFEQLATLRDKLSQTYQLPQVEIVTCDDVSAIKPDPEGYRQLLVRFGLQPSQVVAVGDSAYDIIPAKELGMVSVGISHGFGSRQELQAAGAEHIVNSLAELTECISTLQRGDQKVAA